MALPKKRPDGIVGIAVLWTLSSIYGIYVSLNGIIVDLGALPYLSIPTMPEWYRFGVPAELMINFFGLAYSFLTLIVIYGLWTARSWSYDFGLALPVFIIILNFAGMMLYSSAPPELGAAANTFLPYIAWNLFFLVCTWGYLTRPHVKQYLNKIPTPPPTPVPVFNAEPKTTYSEPTLSPQPAPIAKSDVEKFCRYCGTEQKSDAVFCEKCGKHL